jgi:hypothetical protein
LIDINRPEKDQKKEKVIIRKGKSREGKSRGGKSGKEKGR